VDTQAEIEAILGYGFDDQPDDDSEVPDAITVTMQDGSTIPSGAAVTVDAAGEVGIDTTADDFVYYGGAKRVLTYEMWKSITLESPADADSFLIFKAPYAMTITDIHCIVDPGDAAESAVIDIQECDANGDNCATVDAAITCDNDGAEDDGSLSNGTIDAGDWVLFDVGAVTGTVSNVTATITQTKDAE
jgi:hypothetical protein